jgi:hypothetical protein
MDVCVIVSTNQNNGDADAALLPSIDLLGSRQEMPTLPFR